MQSEHSAQFRRRRKRRVAATNRLEGKFGTLALWDGKNEFDLYAPFLVPDDEGDYEPVALYYPNYYRSMLSRLYLFDAKEYVSQWTTWAVRFSEVTTQHGHRVKRAEQSLQFKTHEHAVEHMQQHPGENWRIVGLNPGQSCVPLEPLRRLRQVYRSPTSAANMDGKSLSIVEIFELSND